MKKAEETKVEVDMVPLIDIISLLLMFLIIVGDTQAQANAIQMKLPRADQAKTDKEWKDAGVRMEGRIVVQLKPQDGKFLAVISNRSFELVEKGSSKTLLSFLEDQVQFQLSRGMATKAADGAVNIPVKLRIPEDCPMSEVESVMTALARVGLVNVQYAAEPVFKR